MRLFLRRGYERYFATLPGMAGKVPFWYGTHGECAGVLEMGITELPEIL